MVKIAILASGEGTNAQRIMEYFKESTSIKVVVVIANKPQAGVLARADRWGMPRVVISKSGFELGEALETLKAYEVDWVILAGFLLKVPQNMLDAYPQRIINIHPALLPKYGGKGMYGHHVHEAVLAHGETESGITVHLVNEHYDEGEHLFQARCIVLPDDTPDSLAARVHELEYAFFPQVIEDVILNR